MTSCICDTGGHYRLTEIHEYEKGNFHHVWSVTAVNDHVWSLLTAVINTKYRFINVAACFTHFGQQVGSCAHSQFWTDRFGGFILPLILLFLACQ